MGYKKNGFTLVQILFVIAIIGMISAFAIPAYSSYTRQTELQEAFMKLLDLRTQQDLYWTNDHDYGTTDCSIGALPTPSKYFTYICNINNSKQGYLITAKGQGGLLNYNFTIDQSGNRVTIDFPGATGLPASCWMTSPGSC